MFFFIAMCMCMAIFMVKTTGQLSKLRMRASKVSGHDYSCTQETIDFLISQNDHETVIFFKYKVPSVTFNIKFYFNPN